MGLFGFLFGNDYSNRARRDRYRPSTIFKNAISPINDYGTCFGCDGNGTKTLECTPCHGTGHHTGMCKGCNGSGRFERPAKPCFQCSGRGKAGSSNCRKCSGTGNFKPPISEPCRRCHGSGKFSSLCRKCSGSGNFTVQCRRCGGSGYHCFGVNGRKVKRLVRIAVKIAAHGYLQGPS